MATFAILTLELAFLPDQFVRTLRGVLLRARSLGLELSKRGVTLVEIRLARREGGHPLRKVVLLVRVAHPQVRWWVHRQRLLAQQALRLRSRLRGTVEPDEDGQQCFLDDPASPWNRYAWNLDLTGKGG